MCRRHYRNWRKHNDPVVKDTPEFCTVADCGKPNRARGFCVMHYARWQKYGSPLLLKPIAAKHEPSEHDNGYVYVNPMGHPHGYGNRRMLQHRLMMSESLGRLLLATETVHHKNGNKSDNRLTKGHELGGCPPECCNLELWSTKQPYGQRVSDKIAWAREILLLYAPDSLDASKSPGPGPQT
jgi:hypothetical protein